MFLAKNSIEVKKRKIKTEDNKNTRDEYSEALGKKMLKSFKCFFINEPSKIDDTTVYDIMGQLTDDVDLSDLPSISI